MHFQLLGIPVHVQVSFWFTAGLLLGFPYLNHPVHLAVWVFCVFVSIIVHELGHATVMTRYGLRPEIALHGMGGHAAAHGLQRLSRGRKIFVSFAGPLAGFVFAAMWIALALATEPLAILSAFPYDWVESLTSAVVGSDALRQPVNEGLGFLLRTLIWINVAWGFFNLVPVLPLDGGHILEDALGPRRFALTCYVSLAFCALAILYAALPLARGYGGIGSFWLIFIFGGAGWQTYRRLKDYEAATGKHHRRRRRSAPPEVDATPEVRAKLAQARRALDDEAYASAATAASWVLGQTPPRTVRGEATQVLAWAELLRDDVAAARRRFPELKKLDAVDPAFEGALLLAEGKDEAARTVFEAARAEGDDRKEVVGPLIQLLIARDEVARAAAIALDIVATLSDEDVGQMAEIAAAHGAHRWSARLYEARFERGGDPEDSYAAAREHSREGDTQGALVSLERALRAGLDAERVRGDEAFAGLRDGGEHASAFAALLADDTAGVAVGASIDPASAADANERPQP
ncbi:MAG: site-2 protease family protein [Myxococcota bacterium]